jgi:hypothetical protein
MLTPRLRRRAVAGALATVAAATAVAAPAASAKRAPITGGAPKGMTVIAVAPSGKTTVAKRKGATFSVAPAAAVVSLHLRSADGTYAGPVVAGVKGRRVLLGVKAGTKVGRLVVRGGVGRPAKALPSSAVAANPSAPASKRGVPTGAGKFGYVKGKSKGPSGPGRDQDGDGIPGVFDVDDDGDLVLDNVDSTRRSSPRAALRQAPQPPQPAPGQPTPPQPGPGTPTPPDGGGPAGPAPAPGSTSTSGFQLFSNLKLDLERAVNANAGGITDAQIDAAMSSAQTLAIGLAGGATSTELDCGLLRYCRAGGTGTLVDTGAAFPGTADADGDGKGEITAGSTGDFQLRTGASHTDIGAGDVLIQEFGTSTAASTLNLVFSTTPAIRELTPDGGAATTFTYPAAAGAPGTMAAPLDVASGRMTFTLWRPQRRPITGAGERDWMDIGGLRYTVDMPNGPGPGTRGPGNCPLSTTSSSALTPDGDALRDTAPDRAADPANVIDLTVDLDACLATSGLTWSAGQQISFDLQARTADGDNAAVKITLRRT